MKLPPTFNVPWSSDVLNRLTKNQEILGYFKNLILSLRKMYGDIANAINQNANPQYIAQNAQPTPAKGQLLVWKDTDAGAGASTHYLVYQDQSGSVVTFGSVEKV